MNQVQGLIGSETAWAAKKRAYRMQLSERTSEDIVRQEREIEIEIEEEDAKPSTRYDNLVTKYGKKAVDEYVESVDNYCAAKGKRYKDKVAAAANWMKRDGVATLPGYGIKASVKLPTCCGVVKEFNVGQAMCRECRREWKLLNDLWVEVADEVV